MRQSFLAGFVAALTAVIIWGTQLPIAKDAFVAVNPLHATMIRYQVASVFLVLLLIAREGPQALHYRGFGLRASVIGVFGMSASPMLVFFGISLAGAERAAVITALQPAVAALAQWIFRRKRPATFTLACIAVAFVGVVLVVTKGHLTATATTRELVGSAIILLGAVCWVIYTMGTERLVGWSAWKVTVLTVLPGMIATTLVTQTLATYAVIEAPTRAGLLSVMWPLAYLTFAGVLFSMLAWNFGTRRIGALNATLLINFMPIVTFAFRAWQGHRFLPIELVGALLVVLALVANNLYLRRQYLRRL